MSGAMHCTAHAAQCTEKLTSGRLYCLPRFPYFIHFLCLLWLQTYVIIIKLQLFSIKEEFASYLSEYNDRNDSCREYGYQLLGGGYIESAEQSTQFR